MQVENRSIKIRKLEALLEKSTVDLYELKELLWSGIPNERNGDSVRAEVWKIMLGYLPISRDRRPIVAEKKRHEYRSFLKDLYDKETYSNTETKLLRQIRVDIPRTRPCEIFQHESIQNMMEHILYVWSIRHPASGYVQGINDLVTPFILCFLRPFIPASKSSDSAELKISEAVLKDVEADTYWCLTKVLAQIQDNYTFGQPGIQRLISRLKEIIKRIDEPLYNHLENNGLDFLQFAFRWMNCLLMREFHIVCIIRLWDTYIAEQHDGFSTFHVYVCAGFLVYWSNQLKMMDFQQMMIFMQNFPTTDWSDKEIETLLAEAYVLKYLFHSCPKHFS